MKKNITVRIATVSDYKLAADIGNYTFYETWKHVNTEEDMQIYLLDSFNPEKIKKDLGESYNTFILAFNGDEVIGYAKLRTDRTYPEFDGTRAIEMERIYVKSEFQKLKVGKLMMDFCISLSREQRYDWLWLGVNEFNDKALNFYYKYGFTIFGRKTFQLGNAIDEDNLMKMKL